MWAFFSQSALSIPGIELGQFLTTSTHSTPVGRTLVGLTFKEGTFQAHLCTYSPRTLLLGFLSAFLPGWPLWCQRNSHLLGVSKCHSDRSVPSQERLVFLPLICLIVELLCKRMRECQPPDVVAASELGVGSADTVTVQLCWRALRWFCLDTGSGSLEGLSLRSHSDGRADEDDVVMLPKILGQKPGQKAKLDFSSSCAY